MMIESAQVDDLGSMKGGFWICMYTCSHAAKMGSNSVRMHENGDAVWKMRGCWWMSTKDGKMI